MTETMKPPSTLAEAVALVRHTPAPPADPLSAEGVCYRLALDMVLAAAEGADDRPVRHFKGNLYFLVGDAQRVDTSDPVDVVTVYRDTRGHLWARRPDNFCENVLREDGVVVPRFAPVVGGGEPYERLSGPVHGWFELSYARYLTIPRSILQSMPVPWQARFVRCLEELDGALDWRPRDARYYVTLRQSKYTLGGEERPGKSIPDPFEDYRHAPVWTPERIAALHAGTLEEES